MFEEISKSILMKYLMEHIRDNIYFKDLTGRIIMISEAGAKWMGFASSDEIIGKTDQDVFTSEHAEAACADERRVMDSGIPILGKEEKETWPDGRTTWVTTSKMPLRDDHGKMIGTFGISRDITAHKMAELQAAEYAAENQRFREVTEQDMHMAAELQKTFFPTEYPLFPSGATADESLVQFSHLHHCCELVGGDLCSIRKISETKAGIFLCDVMGHGVQAALGPAIIRAMVEELSCKESDPGKFLGHMNQVLLPILRQGDQFLFASACYMVLDLSCSMVWYASAGHPSPIMVSAESGVRWLNMSEDEQGPALAICENPEYRTVESAVNPDDMVIMYTDGIYEVEDEAGREFGEDQLMGTVQQHRNLSLPDLLSAILYDASRFAANGNFKDDVCMVGFRMKSGIKL